MRQQVWEISSKRSFIQFRISYFHISNITGSFLKFSGRVVTDADFVHPHVVLHVETQSVETFDGRRNAKIRSAAFLATDRFPYFEFVSEDGCKASSGMIRELTGMLAVRGVRQELVLVVNFADVKMNRKKPVAMFRLFGTVSRRALGMSEELEEEIGDEVHIHADIFMIRIDDGS